MDSRPVPSRKRRLLEGCIRWIDMVVYSAVIVGGVAALTFPPHAVTSELAGWEWLIPVWGWILVLGGVGGLAGRVSRYWVIEVPALPLCGVGIGMFFVILWSFQSPYSIVTTTFVLVALLVILRRYVELQLFASEPGDRTIRTRFHEITHRRTADTVRREG